MYLHSTPQDSHHAVSVGVSEWWPATIYLNTGTVKSSTQQKSLTDKKENEAKYTHSPLFWMRACFSHSSTCLHSLGENVFICPNSSLPNLLTQSKTKIELQFTLKRKHTVLTHVFSFQRGDGRKRKEKIPDLWFVQGAKKQEKALKCQVYTNCSISNSIKKINTASIYKSYVKYHHTGIYQ